MKKNYTEKLKKAQLEYRVILAGIDHLFQNSGFFKHHSSSGCRLDNLAISKEDQDHLEFTLKMVKTAVNMARKYQEKCSLLQDYVDHSKHLAKNPSDTIGKRKAPSQRKLNGGKFPPPKCSECQRFHAGSCDVPSEGGWEEDE